MYNFGVSNWAIFQPRMYCYKLTPTTGCTFSDPVHGTHKLLVTLYTPYTLFSCDFSAASLLYSIPTVYMNRGKPAGSRTLPLCWAASMLQRVVLSIRKGASISLLLRPMETYLATCGWISRQEAVPQPAHAHAHDLARPSFSVPSRGLIFCFREKKHKTKSSTTQLVLPKSS